MEGNQNLPEGVKAITVAWGGGSDPSPITYEKAVRLSDVTAIEVAVEERVRAWLGSDEAIAVAVARQKLTNEAVGIAGLPKPTPENAMGAVLVAVSAALKSKQEEQA